MELVEQLTGKCDAVVMLTASNWFTEPVSNRYHYAARFARHLPVLFVQNDLESDTGYFEPSGHENITILHVPVAYGDIQQAVLEKALSLKGVRRPLYWLYNVNFGYFLAERPAVLKVFHATEDYLEYSYADELLPGIETTLKNIDLLVGVAAFICDSYGRLGVTGYKNMFLPNGCDYAFWALSNDEIQALGDKPPQKLAIYQGGINDRVDFELLGQLARAMPDWRFVLCGEGGMLEEVKAKYAKVPNIALLGRQPLDAIRKLCLDATVGLIPYADTPLVGTLLPLKAYEYLAMGLPVVYRRRIASLDGKPGCFFPADTAVEFETLMRDLWLTRVDETEVCRRMAEAKTADYDLRFEQLLETLAPMLRALDFADETQVGTEAALDVQVFENALRGRRSERRFIKRRDSLERSGQKRKRRLEKLYGFIERHPRLKAFYDKRLKASVLTGMVVGNTFSEDASDKDG